MKKNLLKNLLRYTFFFGIGVALFWWIYKDMDLAHLAASLKGINYYLILLAVMLSLLSNLSRALRWNMLIQTMGHKVHLKNTFLSVMVMYLANLVVPRAGEVVRCTVISKYEKIPVTKLLGTVLVERIADLMAMMVIAVFIFALQLGTLKQFFALHPEVASKASQLFTLKNLIILIVVLGLLVLLLVILKPFKRGWLGSKLKSIKDNFKEGIQSILNLKNKWLFIGHTFFIFFTWIFMLYMVFLAFGPTKDLSLLACMFTFLMGCFAMLAPVQGGIGPWHFMVYETLFLYGVAKPDGKVFALVAHTSTNLIYLMLGLLALFLLPVLNSKRGKEV
jgi:glycosyltransferase 2 family protein